MIQRLSPLDTRLPGWKMDDLVERECPICRSGAGEPRCIRPDGLMVRGCLRCGTCFISPAPSEVQLAEFYSTYDEAHRRGASASPAELLSAYKSLGPLGDFRVRELSSIMRIEGRRVLDVGFGRAQFLWCLQALGAEAHGIELDAAAIEIAKALDIRNVRMATIEGCQDDERYDLIVLNDVVEHPLEPFALLQRCATLLSPGGLILIWTPNGAKVRGEKNPVTFRVDLEHMQYLTPQACSFIARTLDLRIAHLETCGFPSLEGMQEPQARASGVKIEIKRFVKSIPGFTWVNQVRLKLMGPDLRLGAYHLFCILQKAEQESSLDS